MSKVSNKLVVLLVMCMVVMGMSIPAFAVTGDTVTMETRLYKNDQYDANAPSANLSMGNDAVLDTTYEEVNDSTKGKYRVTIEFAPSFSAYGVNGYLSDVKIDLDGKNGFDEIEGKHYTLNKTQDTEAVVKCCFYTNTLPTETKKYDIQFTVHARWANLPVAPQGDLYIFPGE